MALLPLRSLHHHLVPAISQVTNQFKITKSQPPNQFSSSFLQTKSIFKINSRDHTNTAEP
jgi:hypothetical protein